jgi:endonuclease YncB( thermonuclease family)
MTVSRGFAIPLALFWTAPAEVQAATSSATGCAQLSVHDGDTIRCGVERIRLANIEAPELPDSPSHCR